MAEPRMVIRNCRNRIQIEMDMIKNKFHIGIVGTLIMVLGLASGYSQTYSLMVQGKVVDEKGKELQGVTVVSENGKNGTSTDFDGKFRLVIRNCRNRIQIEMDMIKNKFHIGIVGTLIMVLGLASGYSQTYSLMVQGKVVDEKGKELQGVTVVSENGKNGTSTDFDGKFSIEIDDGSKILIFSKKLFKDEVEKVEGLENIDVVLKKDVHNTDKRIALGWDEQKAQNLTGAVTIVDGSDLEKSPVANLNLALAGRFSGLTTQETFSELSRANSNLFIRGFSTSRSGGPVVMLDGIMIPYNANQTLDYISPEEIESISLLKDGFTQSMYGILGGNGILQVKTKRGRKGPIEISARLDNAVQEVTTSPTMLSSADYAALRQEAWHNDYSGDSNYEPIFTERQIEKFREGADPLYPNNNWYDYFFKRRTTMQRLGVNARGGNDRVQYYSNANFMFQNGYFNTDQEKYNPNPYNLWVNYRSNVDMKINDYLGAFLRLAGNVKREHTPGEGNASIYSSIFHLPPSMYGPVTPEAFDPETGEELSYSNQVITSGDERNPTYGMLNRRGYRNHTVTNIVSQFGFDLDMSFLTKGLTARGVFAYQTNTVGSLSTLQDYQRMKRNSTNWDELDFVPVYDNETTPLAYSKTHSHYYHLSYQAQINYAREFGKHQLNGIAYMFYQNLTKADTGSPGLFPYNRVSSGVKGTYVYDDRYIVELNTGYSGSEQFSRDKRYTLTPGVGLGWILKNESFLNNIGWLSQAKIRGTWANTATDQNGQGRYTYLDDVTVNRGGPIAYLQYIVNENRFGNPIYAAEIIQKRNIGIDLGFFESFTFSVDIFDEYTDNMMVGATTSIPLFQGIPLGNYPDVNVGEFENKGFEISADFYKWIHSDWKIGLGGHLSKTRNRIINNNEAERADDYIFPFRSQGFSTGQAFGFLIDYSNGNGYINTEEELKNSPEYEKEKRIGDFLFQDLNGDGIVDDRDRVPLGSGSIPEMMYGFHGFLGYKNFDLNVLFQGVSGFSRITKGLGVEEHHYEGVYSRFHQNAWTEERYVNGDKITYPALSTNSTASHENNEFFLYDLSYLRLKNIEIGYTMPLEVSRRIGLDNIRFTLSGQNLLTWDHMKTDDFGPEGNGFGAIPVYRVYNLGVKLIF